jgi:hypothetical protein
MAVLIGNKPQEQFRAIFAEAQKEIVDMLTDYLAQDVPGFEIGRQRVLLKQVDEILQATDEPVLDWIETWLPESYEKGTLYATRSLKELGVAKDSDLKAGFSVIDEEQVAVLAESMVLDVDGAQSQILSKFGQAIRASQLDVASDIAASEQVALGLIRGEGVQGIRMRILDKVLKGEIAPGGYKGSLESYAELLARTRAAEAQTQAMLRRTQAFGVDYVKAIGDGDSCPICTPMDGVVFSISGDDPKYPPLSSVGPPPWHPNCDHRLRPYVPELASAQDEREAKKANTAFEKQVA